MSQGDMSFEIHITCKVCRERLELVTAPKGHQSHPHFRCPCMPADGSLCVLMKATLAPTERA
jgi:hypothetical protein